MNTHAQELYEAVISESDYSSQGKDLKVRTNFNLAQLLKGSGVSLGVRVRGVGETQNQLKLSSGTLESKRAKSHAVWKAH